MYDDLSSLTAKLKMSGVSFQKINDEDGATMQAAVTTTDSEEVKDTAVEIAPADSRLENVQPSSGINTLAWPKAKPALVQNAFSSPAGGIMESVAALSRQAEPEIRERNPVRLDILFTVIGR